MKTLLYLLILLAIALAVAWVAFGIHPKAVYYQAVNTFTSISDETSEQANDVKNTSGKFVDVIKKNYNNQDMTQPNM